MGNDKERLIEAISFVAKKWINPEYEGRVEAERSLYKTETRITPEAVAFAINQQMPQLSVSGLSEIISTKGKGEPRSIGVLHRTDVPFCGLLEWLAVVLSGHEYVGVYDQDLDILLRAFAEEVQEYIAGLPSSFVQVEQRKVGISALIALGVEPEFMRDLRLVDQVYSSIPLLSRPIQNSIAILDGKESRDEIEDFS